MIISPKGGVICILLKIENLSTLKKIKGCKSHVICVAEGLSHETEMNLSMIAGMYQLEKDRCS
jgi:hypothetical protein